MDVEHGSERTVRFFAYFVATLFLIKFLRVFLGTSPLVSRYLPAPLVRVLQRTGVALKDPALLLEDPEYMAETHAFTCGDCGFTIFPAKGREGKFFPDNYVCPSCGADADQFFDTRGEDMSNIMEENAEEIETEGLEKLLFCEEEVKKETPSQDTKEKEGAEGGLPDEENRISKSGGV